MVSFQSFKIEIIYLVFILLLRFLETIQATSRVRRNTCEFSVPVYNMYLTWNIAPLSRLPIAVRLVVSSLRSRYHIARFSQKRLNL